MIVPDFITLRMAPAHAWIIGDDCLKCKAMCKLHNVHDINFRISIEAKIQLDGCVVLLYHVTEITTGRGYEIIFFFPLDAFIAC